MLADALFTGRYLAIATYEAGHSKPRRRFGLPLIIITKFVAASLLAR
jgi:hypothetical protein